MIGEQQIAFSGMDVLKPSLSDIWTVHSNCYAYALRRHDIGWLNPGWIAAGVQKGTIGSRLKDIFSVYAIRRPQDELVRKYIDLFIKDGCQYLGQNVAGTAAPQNRLMFVALCEQNGLYDYHCYRHEGNGRWSSKNNINAPQDHGCPPLGIEHLARRQGFTVPVGYFKMPDLPENISHHSRRKLQKIKSRSNAHFLREAERAGILFSR